MNLIGCILLKFELYLTIRKGIWLPTLLTSVKFKAVRERQWNLGDIEKSQSLFPIFWPTHSSVETDRLDWVELPFFTPILLHVVCFSLFYLPLLFPILDTE